MWVYCYYCDKLKNSNFTIFILKFLTSLLTHNLFTRSCRCCAHSETVFVWSFSFMKLTKWLKEFWEFFCQHHWNLPWKFMYSFFVRWVRSLSAVEDKVPVQAPGSRKSLTTKFCLKISPCTVVLQPLSWQPPMHIIEWPLWCEALLMFTLPILVFLSLLFLVNYTVAMTGTELVYYLSCNKRSYCSLETVSLLLYSHSKFQ